jgi:hypothetical protein
METTPRGNGTISVSYDSLGRWEICVKNDRNVGSYGIFLGDNPFDFALPATLFQLLIIITISQTLHFLLRPLRTPKFICSVLVSSSSIHFINAAQSLHFSFPLSHFYFVPYPNFRLICISQYSSCVN